MKKIVACLLLVSMCLCLFACVEEPYEGTTDKESVQTTATAGTTVTDETDEAEPSDVTDQTGDVITEIDTDTKDFASTSDVTEDSSSETESFENGGSNDSIATDSEEENQGGNQGGEDDKEEDKEPPKETYPADNGNEGGDEDTEEIVTEDPRLSAEYAPVTYFDAKTIYELTRMGVYDDVPGFYGYDEVTYHKEEGKKPYTKILAYCDLQNVPEAYISLCSKKMEIAPIFAIKYRTTTPGISMEIYTDSVNNSVASGNIVRIPVESDGEWHVEYVNLTKIKEFNGATVNYFRFDFMNASPLPKDSYVDFEYFGFFNSDDEVEMFETGKYIPVIYVDPNSGYVDATKDDIVHASSIDMINGMGGAGAPTFGYRGGNSASGVDKFNHNGTTLSGGKLVFSGWTVVEGGIDRFVWSIDGLNWYDATFHQMSEMGNLDSNHINATQSYTGSIIQDAVASQKGGGYQGNTGPTNPEDRARGLACNLLEVADVGDKVNVRFAVIPKSDDKKICIIAYVKNVEVVAEFEYEEETEPVETFAPEMVEPEDCVSHEASIYWYPIEGTSTEARVCLLCGETIESRDVAFYSSLDIIEDINGQKNTGLYGANKTFEKDGSDIVLRNGYDFVLQGWFAINGGVKDYMYSVDGGVTWMVAGNSNNLTDKFGPNHIAAIKKADLGIKDYDVKGMYRVNLPLKQFANVTETNVDVLFGAKLANNETVVITIANIKNVKIPAVSAISCMHEGEKWTPVAGQLRETISCDACGKTIERDVAFYSSFDFIEQASGNISGGFGANKIVEKDGSSIVLGGGNDFVVQGWFATNGGVKDYVYSVDGGETWMIAGNNDKLTEKFGTDHINAIEGANLGIADYDVKGRYRLNFPLGQFMTDSEKTVDVLFGAVPVNNDTVVIKIANIKGVKLPASVGGEQPDVGEPEETTKPAPEPEEEMKFIKAIDHLYIGDTDISNPNGGWGGELFTYDASEIAATGFTVKWIGWAGVDGGFNSWVYSTDGGNTWKSVGGNVWNTDDPGRVGALTSNGFTNATANGSFNMVADLSALTALNAEVIFAAIPNSDTNKIIPMVKIINIKLPNDCTHPGVASWSPVAGELKESGACTRCGETVTRDITFVVCLDAVKYNGGTRGWAATAVADASSPYVVNNVASMPIINGTGITVTGWVGLNGGVSQYMWSIDGVTWHDAGSGYYQNTNIPGAVNGYNTGISNVSSGCQFNLNLSGLCDLEAGTYTIYFGAVPANNTTVVVPITQIENVVVS